MDEYKDIVELFYANRKQANALIAHGYRLLNIQCEAFWCPSPADSNQFGMRRRASFVLGRPEGVERIEVEGV